MLVGKVNRVQALVLGFFAFAWFSLLVILLVAPEVYDQALNLPLGNRQSAEVVFVLAISALIFVLAIGIIRRWRWTFWLILVAFLSGVLRIPASILEILGVIPANGPIWYILLQGVLGLVQFAIGLAMLSGYRRAGTWGRFSR